MLSKILLLVVAFFGFAAASLTEIHPETGDVTTRRLGAKGPSMPVEQFHQRHLDDDSCLTRSSVRDCRLSGNTAYVGECFSLFERIDDQWCLDEDGSEFCCGGSLLDCCELTGGGIQITGGGIAVVMIVPLIIIVVSIVLCSCACCR